jgi:3-hydroxybutyryl-CoA dehydrogenase
MTAPAETESGAVVEVPDTCGVVGGGRMGAGIAHALLLAGATVCVLERDEDAARAARDRVERAVVASAKRGQIESVEAVLARAAYTTRIERLAGSRLVVEAVPEDVALKVETMARLESVVAPEAVIATNTSSISLDVLAAALRHPERLVGLHFFNPVPASRLIEVVHVAGTPAELVERAAGWVRRMAKTPVVVRNAPGFASSRLGVALGLEAIRMVEEGVASAEDIDTAMTLGYGHPTGPLRLTDLVGIDVRLGIARYLAAELGPRFEPPPLMVEMVERGDLGRKSGRGFYDWDD